ncbi:RhoGAP-domain-containing protein [Basidiobolus meristosporus CBS 931.73]|uniref:RhoGAP-domain-containing protein n=1 Tax=Basidiobolus meristosporus CBS 931.73 TaxID=1314790 RepID=A0A1Y1Y996_9FUNG|nr:RhoGAP-domain-containing protein [Basidiobolus meristosporus CBS 931.73]|eukprot:ORX94581.1 RhoGAP-domain-containing protein [Basidiobolus meristosporus CBS 931.73]
MSGFSFGGLRSMLPTIATTTSAHTEKELSELVDTKIIYQSGVDLESKPMLVFCACNLPNPKEMDYDQILSLILAKLDQFVESDYTVVLFSGGAVFRPSWVWLLKAYGRLSRKYKKNLKNLYVVHPSRWPRLILDTMNIVISPKFAKKVVYVETLSKLASYVPIKQMQIPEAVYEYNFKFESQIIIPSSYDKGPYTPQAFGVSLETLMGPDAELGIPQFFSECVEFVRANGIEVEGIFRRSPSSTSLKEAKEIYNRGNRLDLNEYGIHVAAVLLKMFFRELPTPVFPAEIYDIVREMQSCSNDTESIRYIRNNIFPTFSKPMLILLAQIFRLMNDVSTKSSINLMTPYNLAVVWSPNLVRSGNPMVDVMMCTVGSGTVGSVVRLCIEYVDALFPESLYPIPDSDIVSPKYTASANTTVNGFEGRRENIRGERHKSINPRQLYRASTSEDLGSVSLKNKRYSAYFPRRNSQEE